MENLEIKNSCAQIIKWRSASCEWKTLWLRLQGFRPVILLEGLSMIGQLNYKVTEPKYFQELNTTLKICKAVHNAPAVN